MNNDARVVDRVLELRRHPGSRAHLRRASSTATEHLAYPHLSGLWVDDNRHAVLAFAALAAAFHDVEHDPARAAGALMRQVAGSDLDRMERRLIVTQTSNLPTLLTTLRHVLTHAQAQHLGLDYADLWTVLRDWDSPIPDRRNRVRTHLCESFYSHHSSAPLKENPAP